MVRVTSLARICAVRFCAASIAFFTSAAMAQVNVTWDRPAFDANMASIGASYDTVAENFAAASSRDQQLVQSGDAWTGFTLTVLGGAPQWWPSKYCAQLNAGNCIYWNSSAPAQPGMYTSVGFGPSAGVRFTLAQPALGVFLDFVDWNDMDSWTGADVGSQHFRSQLVVVLDDGTQVSVTPADIVPTGGRQGSVGISLQPAQVTAGRRIVAFQLVGYEDGGVQRSEVVSLTNIVTFPFRAASNGPAAVPTLDWLGLGALSALLGLMGWRRSRSAG